MKLCPQGHENRDDAVRCSICFRQFDAAAPVVALELSLSAPPMTLLPGAEAEFGLRVRLSGSAQATVRISASGGAAQWLPAESTTQTVSGGPELQVPYRLHAPADTQAGHYILSLVATAVSPEGPPAQATLHLHVEAQPEPSPTGYDDVEQPTWLETVAAPVDRGSGTAQSGHAAGWTGEEPPLRDRTTPQRRRPWLLAGVAGLAGALGLAAAGVLLWLVWPHALTPQQALELSPQQAAEELQQIVNHDRAAVLDSLAEPGYITQLSSKCPGLSGDLLTDAQGSATLGSADGILDTPDMTESDILAFHLGLQRRFGAGVLLATRDEAVGAPIRNCPDPAAHWYTFLVDEQTSWGTDLGAARQFCQEVFAEAPSECAAFDTSARKTRFP